MARIVIVQDECINGRLHPLEWEEPASCCDHWPDGDLSHGLYDQCPTASFCDGAPRRVLDPGSFVEVWWCKDCRLAAEYRSDLACPHADVLPQAVLILDALAAGSEQTGGDL